MATVSAEQPGDDDEDDDADDGDGHVLAAEVGGGAFLNRRRDLLHAGGPGVGREHVARRPTGVTNGEKTAEYDQIDHGLFPLPSAGSLGGARGAATGPNSREKRPQRPRPLGTWRCMYCQETGVKPLRQGRT